MANPQKRNELAKRFWSENLVVEMLRSKAFDHSMANLKKQILEMRNENLSLRLENRKFKVEEPIFRGVGNNAFKDMENCIADMKQKEEIETKSSNDTSGQIKAVTQAYKNIFENIKSSSNQFKDIQKYEEVVAELSKTNDFKKDDINQLRDDLDESRQIWREQMVEKKSLFQFLCDIEVELEDRIDEVGIPPLSLTQTKESTEPEETTDVFKKPRTPKRS